MGGKSSKSCRIAERGLGLVIGDRPCRAHPRAGLSLGVIDDGAVNSLRCRYSSIEQIGTGGYATVFKAVEKSTEAVCAVKTISKWGSELDVADINKEGVIMKSLDHPNVVKLFESFEDRRNVYLVMPLCKGGDLCTRVEADGPFREGDARILMQQILQAVQHINSCGIVHRDIKPENCVLTKSGSVSENVLQVLDFGFACFWQSGDAPLTELVGTTYYIAPEMIARSYDVMVDSWSCGIVMYVLLCGRPPFNGHSEEQIHTTIRKMPVLFPAEFKDVSADATALIRKMLKKKVQDRFSVEQALAHAWVHTPRIHVADAKLPILTRDSSSPVCASAMIENVRALQSSKPEMMQLREAIEKFEFKQDEMLAQMRPASVARYFPHYA